MHRKYIKKNESAIKHHHQICIVPAMNCRRSINGFFLLFLQFIYVMFSLLFLCYFCCHFILLLWCSLQQLHRWTIFPTRRIILLSIYSIKAAFSSNCWGLWTHQQHYRQCNIIWITVLTFRPEFRTDGNWSKLFEFYFFFTPSINLRFF